MDTLNTSGNSTHATPLTNPSTTTPITRPVTSKARGVCKYYTDPRGCYAKSNCKFLHSDPPKDGEAPILTPYDSSKSCKFYAQGYCKRGDQCWFLHVDSREGGQGPGALEEEDDLCSICFEKPTTYGLLAGCNHIFCMNCIKQWRDPRRKPGDVVSSGNTKKCPMCRTASRFITPSSKFWTDVSPEKQKTIDAYRESMSRVPCRYFQKSLAKQKNSPKCPFGRECFYQHKKEDGTIYEFKESIESSMRRYRNAHPSRQNAVFGDVSFFPMNFDFSALDIATALDLDFDIGEPTTTMLNDRQPTFMAGGDFDGDEISGETMAAAFDLLRSHIRETAGVGPNRATEANVTVNLVTSGGNRAEGPEAAAALSEEALMMMRLLDFVRTSQVPPPRPATNSAIPNSNRTTRGTTAAAETRNRPRTTTRNGTAAVADEASEEPSEQNPEESRASGYESEGSLPRLQSVSNSSDSENGDDDDDDEEVSDDESLSGNENDLDSAEQLFRQISGRVLEEAMRAFDIDIPNPVPEVPTPESRPSSSARFSTVVERPDSSDNATSSRSASAGVSVEPPVSLLQWAEAVLQLDEPQDDDDDDMPPLESIPGRRLPSHSEDIHDVHELQSNELHRGIDTDDDDDNPPPLEPVPSSHATARDILSIQSAAMEALPPPMEGSSGVSVSRKRSGEQDFTTDGRGRVISIGGPDSSTEKNVPQTEEHDVTMYGQALPIPSPMQRQASEFTTDGRGRVISVGDPVDSRSSTTEIAGVDSEVGPGSTSAGDEREGQASPPARGLFGWLGALF